MSKLLNDLRSNKIYENSFAFGDAHHLSVCSEQFTVSSLEKFLLECGHTNIEITEIQPTIEDCFMEISRDGARTV
jgi:hypothetical protein